MAKVQSDRCGADEQACYDPEEGPKVWERMSQMAKGEPRIPRFMSTHPENKDREARLESHMDEVSSNLDLF